MNRQFIVGNIGGVVVKDINKNLDSRGWLAEIYRSDESKEYVPAMSYISVTKSRVVRGPHEHKFQTDYFVFIGDSRFEVVLWDNREGSSTYNYKMIIVAGGPTPKIIVVPPGVVHAYRNIGPTIYGSDDGLVINLPDRLYRGEGKVEEDDNIRHENDPNTPFTM